MRGGVKALLLSVCFVATGCTASANDIKIRALADPASKLRSGNGLLAEARAQFALGNVGLALEGFRKALRDRPDSIEALGGIAACYDSMGRYELSRQSYEAALAIAPNDPVLLNSFAASLEQQGNRAEAVSVRAEAARIASASEALDRAEAGPVPAAPRIAQVQSARPAPVATSVRARTTPPAPVVTVAQAHTTPSTPAATIAKAPATVSEFVPVVGSSVTVALAPARPAETRPAVRIPAPVLAEAKVDIGAAEGPRLERLSPGVVSLITIEQPALRSKVVARTAATATLRWVPIRTASASRPNIRLLNAARHQGLASRTRGYLADRGWRKIEIGDADRVRRTSLVLYPASRRTLGRRLAAQFGFAARAVPNGDVLVVLLGRDAAGRSIQIRG